MINDQNYIHIEGWMINKLQLKGNDLLVYAIIYGFSQDENSRFTGSLQYLADWCNSTKQGIQKNLKSLIDKGLIQKFETLKNNIKYCEYSCIPYNTVVYPIQQSCTNNTSNNIDNTNTKVLVEKSTSKKSTLIATPHKEVTSKSNTETSTNKKVSNMYSKCLDMINKFSTDIETVRLLKQYLDMRLAMKDKPMYANQWQGLLNKLDKLDDTEEGIQKIIKQSIELGYASFFPYNPNIGKGSKQDWHNDVAHRNVKSVSMTDREREDFEKEIERRELTGERVTF